MADELTCGWCGGDAETCACWGADDFPEWPNCITPDCGNKQCTWANLPHCFPCAERAIGHAELIRRYDAAHDLTWEEAKRLDAEEDEAEAIREVQGYAESED